MKNLAFLFKNNKNCINNFKEEICRGAKRKTERTPVLPCDSLINIIKTRQDPIILPDEYYPPWLLNLPSKRVYNRVNDYEIGACMGTNMPDPELVPGLFKFIDIARRKKHIVIASRKNQSREIKALKGYVNRRMTFYHPDDGSGDEDFNAEEDLEEDEE